MEDYFFNNNLLQTFGMPKRPAKEKTNAVVHALLVTVAVFLAILLVFSVYLRFSLLQAGPVQPPLQGFCGTSTNAACSADTDCIIGGCSAQVCQGKGDESASTCEFRECYDRVKYDVSCGCNAGKCSWK